jgi:CheY-like chemotaxis protein
LNLLLNAVQALADDRAATNEIRVAVKSHGPDRVLVEVADNGSGIPPQVRGRIFEPFFTTKPVGIGTGLGLAICHGIVASLGGTLTFETEVGRGSVFRVELPAAERAIGAADAGRADAEGAASAARATQGRILVVDDEPIVCFSLERLLSKEGEVIAVTSARQALAAVAAGARFDVILCDLMLPEMDGPALHDALRSIAPMQAERMVFVTGGVFTARARDFLASVKNPRLGKPFEIDSLLATVRRLVSNDTNWPPPVSRDAGN